MSAAGLKRSRQSPGLHVASALGSNGSPSRLVLIGALVQRMGEEKATPSAVALRLILAGLAKSGSVQIYVPGRPGEWWRLVAESDAFGRDRSAAPRFEVRQYQGRTERCNLETGERSVIDHRDVLERGGRLKSVEELEDRPVLRGRAGALTFMQQAGGTLNFAVAEADAVRLLGDSQGAASDAEPQTGVGLRWTDQAKMDLARKIDAMKSAGERAATKLVAEELGLSRARVREKAAEGRLLMQSSPAAASSPSWVSGLRGKRSI